MITINFAVNPPEATLIALAQSDATNPFLTPAYVRARGLLREDHIVFQASDGSGPIVYCSAFMRSGRLFRALDIPSLPAGMTPDLAAAIGDFCRRQRVTQLEACTFGSPSCHISPFVGEHARVRRAEYVWDLTVDKADWSIGRTHRRWIKKAENAGATMLATRGLAGLTAHLALVGVSAKRRRDRGENIDAGGESAEARALLQTGAGALCQVALNGDVISSMLLLNADRGGYHHSSGTTPKGMSIGASHFLIHSIAIALQAQGKIIFNLGGATQGQSGLQSFKSHFGTHRVDLEAIEAGPAGGFTRAVAFSVHTIQRARARLRFA